MGHCIQDRNRTLVDGSRKPWVISLAISVLAHAAVLAWGAIDIPELGESSGVVDRSGTVAADETREEPMIQVIKIQPPGTLASGGAPGSQREGAEGGAAGVATISAPVAEPQSLRGSLTLSPAQPTNMVLVTTEGPSPGLLLADLPASRRPSDRSARSNRGIVRKGASSGRRERIGEAGFGASGRGGVGRGGSGTASIGTGTDCITAGTAIPAGRLPSPTLGPAQIRAPGTSRGRSGGVPR